MNKLNAEHESMPESGQHQQQLDIPGWIHVYSGKVRDIYEPTPATAAQFNEPVMLVVASDRISAYDYILPTEIPDKGKILTQLSHWWFEQLSDIPNHLVAGPIPEIVAGRAMLCKKLDMFSVECIVRGYLTGSVLKEYQQQHTVTGISVPQGLKDGSAFPQPLFTPSTKAEQGLHDENISFDNMVEIVGQEDAEKLKSLTLGVYKTAQKIAQSRGIILADTKLEFGKDLTTGRITLGDEVLTPDSSRFWDASSWQPGQIQASFDKQFVRDWLTSKASGWDRNSGQQPPELPEEIVEKTRDRYLEAYRRLTGTEFSA